MGMPEKGAIREALEKRGRWEFSRSGGPGGQHQNSASTKAVLRVELQGLLEEDLGLDGEAVRRAEERLAGRVNGEGELMVASSEERSQARNRETALERAAGLLAGALVRPKGRKRTRPSRGAKRRRLEAKKRRGEVKRMRRDPGREGG